MLLAERLHAACPSGRSGLDNLVENPPCKVTTLVLYFWITLICWLAWLSLSFVSLFTMRDFVGYRRLLACWPGFIIFWFAEPGQIKFCAAFPHWPFWLELLLFLHDCHIMATVVLFSSRRRRRASISGCCQESAYDAVIVCCSSFCC